MEENIFDLDNNINEKPKPKFVIKETSKKAPQEPSKEEKVEVKQEVVTEKTNEDIVTLQRDLYIRQYPGFWEHVLTYKQITKEDKKNIIKGQVYAILKKGTQVKIRRRINIIGGEVWGEISSGYIILSSKDGVYAK